MRVMRKVTGEVPADYHGTRVLKLECLHVTVRKRSARIPKRAKCTWCTLGSAQ